jgi:hypothetical protein
MARARTEYEWKKSLEDGSFFRLLDEGENEGENDNFNARPTGDPVGAGDASRALGLLKQEFPHWPWNQEGFVNHGTDVLEDWLARHRAPDEVNRMRQEGANPTDGSKFVRRGQVDDLEYMRNPAKWNQEQKRL